MILIIDTLDEFYSMTKKLYKKGYTCPDGCCVDSLNPKALLQDERNFYIEANIYDKTVILKQAEEVHEWENIFQFDDKDWSEML